MISRAFPSDAEAICAIYNSAINERGSTFETELRSPGAFEERVNDDHFPLLVASEGEGTMIGKLFTDNAASIRLVERCGFTTVGLHRRHGKLDGNWRDVLVVELLLNPAPSTAP